MWNAILHVILDGMASGAYHPGTKCTAGEIVIKLVAAGVIVITYRDLTLTLRPSSIMY